MATSREIANWLKNSGYEYHCFISWASTDDEVIKEFAFRLKKDIETSLQVIGRGNNCKVFLSEPDIQGGAKWKKVLGDSLCRSIAMICICTPDYYTREHKWCGFEWGAMQRLEKQRLPANSTFGTIIPVIIIKDPSMPTTISKIQSIDLSTLKAGGCLSFFKEAEYNTPLMEIVNRITQIADTLFENGSIAGCDQFALPKRSIFASRYRRDEVFPFRDEH